MVETKQVIARFSYGGFVSSPGLETIIKMQQVYDELWDTVGSQMGNDLGQLGRLFAAFEDAILAEMGYERTSIGGLEKYAIKQE